MTKFEAESLANAFGPWLVWCAIILGLAIVIAAVIKKGPSPSRPGNPQQKRPTE